LTRQLRFVTASGPPGSPSTDIAEWLNRNLNCVRTFGAPQLYLHGPTGIGKTHLLKSLEPALRIFYLNMTEDWMDGYDDDKYDLIVLEEFFSQKTLQFMNQLLDGQPMPLKIRNGCNGKLKRKNLPIIITSNFGLHEIYAKVDMGRKETFNRRVHPVYSPTRLEVAVTLAPRDEPPLLSDEVLSPLDSLQGNRGLIDIANPVSPPLALPEPQPQPGSGNISHSQIGAPEPYMPPTSSSRWRSRAIEVREDDLSE